MRSGRVFVGRSVEIDLLRRRAALPTAGTFVIGEPGIGKSQLVREALGSAEGLHTLVGMGWQGTSSSPYFPWIQIISAAAELVGEDVDAAWEQRLGPLAPARHFEPPASDGHLVRDLLGVAVSNFLTAAAAKAERPVVIIIEDIHSADPDSIELASWVLRRHVPVALVITSRPQERIEPTLSGPLERLHALCSTITLQPLAEPEVSELLNHESAWNLDATETLKITGGVPLAIHDLIDARRSTLPVPDVGTPRARLGLLDQSSREVLVYAALLGNEFDIPTLSSVIGEPPAKILEKLQQSLRSGLVERIEPTLTHFAFSHETVRERVEDSLDPTDRAACHERILQALMNRPEQFGSDIAALAHHASHAAFVGDANLAVALNLDAGDSAMAQAAPGMARRHYDRAIELSELARAPAAVRLRAQIGSVRALKTEASPDFERAMTSLLRRVSQPDTPDEAFVDAALLLPTNHSTLAIAPEPDSRTILWLERALERVGNSPTNRRARVLIELSIHRRHKSEVGVPPGSLIDEALEIAISTGDDRLEAYIYSSMQWLTRSPQEPNHVLARIDEFESRTSARGEEAFVLGGARITTLLRAGRFQAARQELERLEASFAPLPPFFAWAIGRWRAALYFLRGEHQASELEALAAFEHAKDSPFAEVAFEYLGMQLAVILRERIEIEAAEPMVAEMVHSRPDYPAYLAAYAWLLSDLGRHEEARRQLAPLFSRDSLWNDQIAVEWMPFATMAATAAAELGEIDWCKQMVELLDSHKDDWIVWGTGIVVDGPVRLRRAYAAIVAGDLQVAEEDLKVAREQVTEAGAHGFVPVLLHHEAQLAIRNGNISLAVDLATRASDSAAEIGLETASEILAAFAFDLAAQDNDRRESATPRVDEPAASATSASLRRRDSVWLLSTDDSEAMIPHVKGMLALATLLERPGKEVHALDLAAVMDGHSLPADSQPLLREAGAPLIDEIALREYRARIVELEEVIDEAQRFNDPSRRSNAQDELDFILEELGRSTGLGERPRLSPSSSERARVRVTKSLRAAIARVLEASPGMGDHLANTIRTGAFCSYQPTRLHPVRWRVSR